MCNPIDGLRPVRGSGGGSVALGVGPRKSRFIALVQNPVRDVLRPKNWRLCLRLVSFLWAPGSLASAPSFPTYHDQVCADRQSVVCLVFGQSQARFADSQQMHSPITSELTANCALSLARSIVCSIPSAVTRTTLRISQRSRSHLLSEPRRRRVGNRKPDVE
jgi:hypothetical protein